MSAEQHSAISAPDLYDRSGQRYSLDNPRWRGEDGSPLAVSALPGLRPEQIHHERFDW